MKSFICYCTAFLKIKVKIDGLPRETKQIFESIYADKENQAKNGVIIKEEGPLNEDFQFIREIFGGRIKSIFTGSAPISGQILQFFRVTLGCHALVAYGATETSGASTFQIPFDCAEPGSLDNVGPPTFLTEIKLIDVPEMNLVAKRDNKGEVNILNLKIFSKSNFIIIYTLY
jgi:long-chain acyl-CoA synthetase